jgi:hypothetical protein
MPARVVDEPLALACVFSDGSQTVRRVGEVPNPVLARQLLAGLAAMVHPHGSVDSVATVITYMGVVRLLVRGLHEAGHRGGLAELTRARLTGFLWGLEHRHDATARAILLACDRDGGVLAGPVREVAAGRPFKQRPPRRPLTPYSEGEWTRLRQVCRGVVDAAFTAHRRALTEAREGADPRRHGWSRPNVCWLLTREGPLRIAELKAMPAAVPLTETDLNYGTVRACHRDLFVRLDVVIAYRLLFGAYSGIVPDGIDGLGIEDLDWAGDATILLDYVKGRTAAESLTLPRRAVRLLERWLEHSTVLRRFAPAGLRDELWLRYQRSSYGPWHAGPVAPSVLHGWVGRHGLLGDEGRPLVIHRHRIRTTFLSLRERGAWFGSRRATVDPNHSPAVEGDHYLTVGSAAQREAVERVIEGAQADLLRKAHPPRVLDSDETARLAARLPELVADLRLDDGAIRELLAGRRDVFVASCADPLAGAHGPAGQPCPARPWVCLLCPLAIFTPRHVANLLRMKAFFARQWQQMPAAHFMAVFGPYAHRVDEVIGMFAGHDPTLLDRAAAQVRDSDDELPLRPEERTA